MNNGFIFYLVNALSKVLRKIALVELFKVIAEKLTVNQLKLNENKNTSIDIYIILKWILILCIWINSNSNFYLNILVFYLIFENLHTYFHIHLWDTLNTPLDIDRQRNRFIKLLSATAFSNLCFGYLYAIPFQDCFNFSKGFNINYDALYYSIANSLTATAEGVKPKNTMGNFLSVMQVSITFLFVAVILNKSIPTNDNQQNENSQ